MTEYERCLRIWQSWEHSAPEEIQARLPRYQMLHAYHSVKLENPQFSFNCVASVWEGAKVSQYTGDLYQLIALNNHRVAFALADACLRDKEPLSVELLCGLQHALSCGLYTPTAYVEHEDRPGELKHSDQVIGLIDVGASPDDIEDMLEQLVNEMPRVSQLNDPLVSAAYLHARLVFLKPFAVANEMVSRLVLSYWLMLNGHPPVLIPGEEATAYRQALEAFDVREDIEPLALFFSDKIVEYWDSQMSAPSQPKSKPLFTLRF